MALLVLLGRGRVNRVFVSSLLQYGCQPFIAAGIWWMLSGGVLGPVLGPFSPHFDGFCMVTFLADLCGV